MTLIKSPNAFDVFRLSFHSFLPANCSLTFFLRRNYVHFKFAFTNFFTHKICDGIIVARQKTLEWKQICKSLLCQRGQKAHTSPPHNARFQTTPVRRVGYFFKAGAEQGVMFVREAFTLEKRASATLKTFVQLHNGNLSHAPCEQSRAGVSHFPSA